MCIEAIGYGNQFIDLGAKDLNIAMVPLEDLDLW